MIEPKIQIGHHVLTEAQAAAVWLVVNGLWLRMECALDDADGDREPTTGLTACLQEILEIMRTEQRA